MGNTFNGLFKRVLVIAAIIMLVLITVGLMVGCGAKEESPVALETARETANANSRFNATRWRAENGFGETSILARGDSTQQPRCPQGDGWASVDLLNAETKAVVLQLKCSTFSPAVGCVKASDFKDREALANQENRCSTQVPYPIKRIEQ